MIAGAQRSDNDGQCRSKNLVVRHLAGRFLRRASESAAVERPRRILGVGCGEGLLLASLAAPLPGAQLHGLELDEATLEEARTRCPGVTLVRGDACALPFGDQSFDLVVCLERKRRRRRLLSVTHEPVPRFGTLLRGRIVTILGPPTDHRWHRGAREFAALCRRGLDARVRSDAFPGLLVYGTV